MRIIPETEKRKEKVAMKEDTVFEEELRETLDAFLLAVASSEITQHSAAKSPVRFLKEL